MAYEFSRAMGYIHPGYWPQRPRIIEVYGTLPEAQEFVRDDLDLTFYPPPYSLLPPSNPRTSPYQRVTSLPIKPYYER